MDWSHRRKDPYRSHEGFQIVERTESDYCLLWEIA